ncbi:hypothetical protein B0H15DRAFT_1026182 [Mycena belliarum]|uniref:Uncharacterized protein n=1 Tax=Mycena belliarum TaxID=1033014 RepID=A0AAD6TV39_9AGAR|nr:hypothetical protein B0H15DRAFT_1026182 [Mycena belliae]
MSLASTFKLLEWTWGLGRAFEWPTRSISSRTFSLFFIPHQDIIRAFSRQICLSKLPLLASTAPYSKDASFLSIQRTLSLCVRVSEVPPHVALAPTRGKLMKHRGDLTGATHDAVRTSAPRPEFSKDTLANYVPPSLFADAASDETMVEAEDSPETEQQEQRGPGLRRASPPRRRLYPHETVEQDYNNLPSVASDDEDVDSHQAGAD